MEYHDNVDLVITATRGGSELSELIRALHGKEVPKALALISSEGSLLQQTVANFHAAMAFQRVTVLVPEPDEESTRGQLEAWPDIEVVAVPPRQGGACALMLVLAESLLHSPQADIAVISAECYLADPQPFVDALIRAYVQLGLVPAVLLGAAATNPELRHHWLVPGIRLDKGVFSLADVCHPESKDESTALFVGQRAMWNTSALVARGPFLLRTLARALPPQAESIAHAWQSGRSSPGNVAEALAGLPAHGYALEPDDVLMQDLGNVAVARVEGSGFSAWRSPSQVFRSLRRSFERAWLLSRLNPAVAAAWTAPAPSQGPLATSASTSQGAH